MDPNSGRLYTPDEMDALAVEEQARLVRLDASKDQAERISRAVAELAAKEKAASEPTATKATPVSIDSDPEFFHGFTFWGEKVSAQIVEASSADEYRNALVIHRLGVDDGHGTFLPTPDARRLRDLLNVATARGFL